MFSGHAQPRPPRSMVPISENPMPSLSRRPGRMSSTVVHPQKPTHPSLLPTLRDERLQPHERVIRAR